MKQPTNKVQNKYSALIPIVGSKSKQEQGISEELYDRSWNSSLIFEQYRERERYVYMKMMLFSIIDAYKPSVDTDYIQKERKQEESNNINQGK